ncbi:MAG: R3H domain-containing nucleic acid-binding protein [Candidatus Shapirobacteria bacterium]|jgi:spoIIIJ-associated protein
MDNKERNETILQLTCELLGKMNLEVENAFVEDIEDEEGQVLVGVTVANPASLIGFRGRNLAAVQTVLSLMVKSKLGEWLRVLLDVNNYREEQKTRLESMVKNLAEKVLETGRSVALANMSSYERRICHMSCSTIEGVVSESEGEGEDRHVVIKKA